MQKDHPECSVCKKPFSNMEALKNHQPCWEVKPGVVSKKTDNTNGLLVPIHKAELEGYRVGLPEPTILIAQGLAQLCEETALPEDSKDNVLKPFNRKHFYIYYITNRCSFLNYFIIITPNFV